MYKFQPSIHRCISFNPNSSVGARQRDTREEVGRLAGLHSIHQHSHNNNDFNTPTAQSTLSSLSVVPARPATSCPRAAAH